MSVCEPSRRAVQEIHQYVQQHLQQVAALAPRYLALLRREPRPDLEREATLERARIRLQALHGTARRYLPRGSTERLLTDLPPTGRKKTTERRREDGPR